MASDKKLQYERARRAILSEYGVKKTSELNAEQMAEYTRKLEEALKAPAAPAEETVVATEGIAEASGETVAVVEEEVASPAEEVVEAAIPDNSLEIPRIFQPPINSRGDKEPLIDALELIDVFPFVIYKGYAGIGKTSSVTSWAHKKGYDVFEFVGSADMNTFDLVGSFIIEGNDVKFNASTITSAVENSRTRPTVLVIDEIILLRPAVVKSLNSLFDMRKSVDTLVGRFYGSDKLRVVGLMNIEEQSEGFELDLSVVSRALIHEVNADAVRSKLVAAGVVTKQLGEVMANTSYVFGLREVEQLKALKKAGIKEPVTLLLEKYADKNKRDQIRQAFVAVYGSDFNKAV